MLPTIALSFMRCHVLGGDDPTLLPVAVTKMSASPTTSVEGA